MGGERLQNAFSATVKTTCKVRAFPASECSSWNQRRVDSKSELSSLDIDCCIVVTSSSVRWSRESRWIGKPMNINFSMPSQVSNEIFVLFGHVVLILPDNGRLLGGCHKIAFGVIH